MAGMNKRLRALGKQHQTLSAHIRRLLAHGFLMGHPGADRHPPEFLVGENETLEQAVGRVLSQEGAIRDRISAAAFRNFMIVTGNANAELPIGRIEEAIAVLRSEGDEGQLTAADIIGLIGGAEYRIRRIVKGLKSVLPLTAGSCGPGALTHTAAMRELGCSYHVLNATIEMGIVKEIRVGSNRMLDLPSGSAFVTIEERFDNLANQPCSPARIGHFHQVKRLLGRLADEPIPTAFLDDVTDWYIDAGYEPNVSEVHRQIGGCKAQIKTRLKERYRAGDAVAYPAGKTGGRNATLSDLRDGLPAVLGKLQHTALDPVTSGPASIPSPYHLSVAANCEDPVMRTIASVVVLACYSDPTNDAIRPRILAGLGRLIDFFEGSDPTNPTDVRRVLEAVMLAATGAREAEQSQLLYTIGSWPHLVGVYEKYLAQEIIDEDARAFLLASAPALPNGADCILHQASKKHLRLAAARKESSDDDLDDLLTNFDQHYLVCEGRRNFTRALRSHVLRTVERIETWDALPQHDGPVGAGQLIRTDEQAPEGRRSATMKYRVWTWDAVIARVVQRIGPNGWRVQKGRPADWEKGLFENRYVVEFENFLYEDGTQAPLPNVVEFQTARIFDPLQSLETQEAAEAQAKLLVEMGVLPTSMNNRSSGLGHFAQTHASLSRHAFREFGMVLLPLDEHDHWEALAHYSISAKIDQPTRQGEFLSFDIDDGFAQHVGEDGSVSSVFYSYRKKKVHKHGFILSAETDRLAEEFLLKTERRRYGGKPIGEVKRPEGAHPRAPEVARFLMAYGNGNSIKSGHVDASVRALARGLFSVSSHKFKYVWNRLAKESGLTIRQRMERQGHTRESTTMIYNPQTSIDRRENLETSKDRSLDRRMAMLEARKRGEVQPARLDQLTAESATLRAKINEENDAVTKAKFIAEYGRLQVKINAEVKAHRLPRQTSSPDDRHA